MKLSSSGKRIGQSGQELMSASIFSFALHFLVVAAALLLYGTVRPKVYVPPAYSVKLVGLPGDLQQTSIPAPAQPAPIPAPPKHETKPAPREKKAAAKERKAAPKAAMKKGGMPEFASKPKPEKAEEKPAETKHEAAAHPSSGAAPQGTASAGAKTQSVAVTTPGDFKFPPYLGVIREKIGVNWNPPPGAADTNVKVQFTVLRSGRVGDVKLIASSGNFYFDQAAVRAILSSSPFPPLPDGFFRDYESFSVDLTGTD